MKSPKTLLRPVALFAVTVACLLGSANTPRAAEETDDNASASKQERKDEAKEPKHQKHEKSTRAYEKASKALDQRKWDEAIQLYQQVESEGGERADAAYYWHAYAAYKLGDKGKALTALAQLAKVRPDSRWNGDAKQLELEIRQATGETVNPGAEDDDELKLMALDGLMRADSERAISLIKKMLLGTQPPKIRQQALFVLSQSGSPAALEILADFARGHGDPDLQDKAIEYLGLFKARESAKILAEVYTTTADAKAKRSILHSYMVSGERKSLFEVAKAEKDPVLRGESVHLLGVMGAQDELTKLYETETDVSVKLKIMEAFFVGGKTVSVIEAARHETNKLLRLKAVEFLGTMGSDRSGEALTEIYAVENDVPVRKRIIESLFVQGNAKALVAIARKETDPGLKKKVVEQLSIMNSKEGTDYLMEILNK